MSAPLVLVVVVDGDAWASESLVELLHRQGYAVRAFSSAEAFLESDCLAFAHCAIVEVAMVGMSGVELSRMLTVKGYEIPIILLTTDAEDMARRRWTGSGVVTCLLKPVGEAALMHALAMALERT